MKHFKKQYSSLCSLHGKKQYYLHIKREILIFFLKKTLPPQNIVHHIEYYSNLLIEYSLIRIVKPKFSRGNEI